MDRVQLSDALGLSPRAVWVIDRGFPLHEIREIWLKKGHPLPHDSVLSIEELGRKIFLGFGLRSEPLPSSLLREWLRRKLKTSQRALPALTKIAKEPSGLHRIERGLFEGRLAASHSAEEEAMEGRLKELGIHNRYREELRSLSSALHLWMLENEKSDYPFILSQCIRFLNELGWPKAYDLPKLGFLRIKGGLESGLETSFWDALSKQAPLQDGTSTLWPDSSQPRTPQISWVRYPSWDDATDALSKTLKGSSSVILASTESGLSFSLTRSFLKNSLPIARIKRTLPKETNESLRVLLSPLSLPSKLYPREEVVEFIRWFKPELFQDSLYQELLKRGVRRGLREYSDSETGKLSPWFRFLTSLDLAMNQKRNAKEMHEAHLAFLLKELPEGEKRKYSLSLAALEETWEEIEREEEALGTLGAKYSLRKWNQRLHEKLRKNEKLWPDYFEDRSQVPIYGLDSPFQLGLETNPDRLIILGLDSSQILQATRQKSGDLWWSRGERDLLKGDFSILNSRENESQMLSNLGKWFQTAAHVEIWDASYELDGKERENLLPILKAIQPDFEISEPILGETSPLRLESLGQPRGIPPLEVNLPSAQEKNIYSMTATHLDALSKCEFLGLTRSRWSLHDDELPSWEPWQRSLGNVLHAACANLIRAWDAKESRFKVTPEAAYQEALKKESLQGLYRNEWARERVKKESLRTLNRFIEEETEYRARSGASTHWIEPTEKFSYSQGDFEIRGQPDRVDRHTDGWFILDYKTTKSLPSGNKLQEGYSLQLPFYALSLHGKKENLPVIGVQFVSLNPHGDRKKGVFFKPWNGPTPGMLTNVRVVKNSAQVTERSPDEVWAKTQESIDHLIAQFKKGSFKALPKIESDCIRCTINNLCGIRRAKAQSTDEDSDE